MFKWFRDLFRKRGSGLDHFFQEERKIFRFFDGVKIRSVDPMPLYAQVLAKQGEIAADFKIARMEMADDKIVIPAHNRVTKTIRGIFNLKSLQDGFEVEGTLTDEEVLLTLDKFLLYVNDLKKNSPQSSTLSVSENGLSQEDGKEVMKNTSDSGSAKIESCTVQQGL